MKNVSLVVSYAIHWFTHLWILAFQCTYPRCEKYFNRHDNLLQHLKVHREPDERPTLQNLCILPTRYLGEAQVCASQRAESPMDEPVSPVSPLSPVSSPRSIYRRIPSSPYHAYSAPCSITTEPTSIITNMAVSSLRTVLPHSPTENRVHSIPSPRQYGSWSTPRTFVSTLHQKLCMCSNFNYIYLDFWSDL